MIKPLSDRIVVQLTEAEDKSPGGIVLPDTAKEKPKQGKVVASGARQAFRTKVRCCPWT